MPLPNGVTPSGTIESTCPVADWMGNRGLLHGMDGQITKLWQRKAWFTCAMQFKGRRRKLMTPGKYSELFFLDEATAFAAGHRPCGECRREAYKRFKETWLSITGKDWDNADAQLHTERVDRSHQKVTYRASL